MLTVRPLIPAAVAIAAIGASICGWVSWPSNSFPRQYLAKPDPQDCLVSPLGLICHAHLSLSRLQLSSPDAPSTLFSILGLDHTEPPFFPPDECAYPISANYRLAREAVVEAWSDRTEMYDGGSKQWRDIFAAAAVVLLNDTTRTVYLKEVLPKIEAKGENGWMVLCNDE
ncbi:hypothetical protein F66182_7561 [Fusarium sp. NRRL 66182]|nr:hypothetical protein F66182_7561 [Fusarium sp. NRRL 66182]